MMNIPNLKNINPALPLKALPKQNEGVLLPDASAEDYNEPKAQSSFPLVSASLYSWRFVGGLCLFFLCYKTWVCFDALGFSWAWISIPVTVLLLSWLFLAPQLVRNVERFRQIVSSVAAAFTVAGISYSLTSDFGAATPSTWSTFVTSLCPSIGILTLGLGFPALFLRSTGDHALSPRPQVYRRIFYGVISFVGLIGICYVSQSGTDSHALRMTLAIMVAATSTVAAGIHAVTRGNKAHEAWIKNGLLALLLAPIAILSCSIFSACDTAVRVALLFILATLIYTISCLLKGGLDSSSGQVPSVVTEEQAARIGLAAGATATIFCLLWLGYLEKLYGDFWLTETTGQVWCLIAATAAIGVAAFGNISTSLRNTDTNLVKTKDVPNRMQLWAVACAQGVVFAVPPLIVFLLVLSIYQPNEHQLLNTGWTVSASSTHPGTKIENIIDGNTDTRWTGVRNQAPGDWIQLDLGSSQSFNKIVMNAGFSSTDWWHSSLNDYPRNYAIYVSNNGKDWGSPIAQSQGAGILTSATFPRVNKRYVRIELKSLNGYLWSIHELNLYDCSPQPYPTGVNPIQPWNPKYSLTLISTLSGNMYHGGGINDKGEVVAGSTDAQGHSHAVLWSNGKLRDLGFLPGYSEAMGLSINDNEEVVGWAYNKDALTEVGGSYTSRAFLWKNGRMVALGSLPGLGCTVATGINNHGQIVGRAYNPGETTASAAWPSHAFLWEQGKIRDLGVPEGCSTSRASAINDSGQVVGYALGKDQHVHACLWDGTTCVLLREPPRTQRSMACAISNDGDIVGISDSFPLTPHSLWQKQNLGFSLSHSAVQNIGPIPDNIAIRALGVNDQGQVVGEARIDDVYYNVAFLWDPENGVRLLGDMVTNATPMETALAINNKGQILVYENAQLYLLTPKPQ